MHLENSQDCILTPSIREEVMRYAREWIQDKYQFADKSTKLPLKDFDSNPKTVENALAKIVAGPVNYDEFLTTKLTIEAKVLFFEEVLSFFEKTKDNDPHDPTLISLSQILFDDGMFDTSESFLEGANFFSKLVITAKVNQDLILQRTIGTRLPGCLCYDASFYRYLRDSETVVEIASNIAALPTPLSIDVVNQLVTVYAESCSVSFGERACEVIKNLLDATHKCSSPLLRYAVALANEQIQDDAIKTKLGFVKYEGDASNARVYESLPTNLTAESNLLEKRLIAYTREGELLWGRFLRVAADVIGTFDQSLLPMYLSRIADLPLASDDRRLSFKIANSHLTDLKKRISRSDNFFRVFEILIPLCVTKTGSEETATLAKYAHSEIPVLTVKEWEDAFHDYDLLSNINLNVQAEFDKIDLATELKIRNKQTIDGMDAIGAEQRDKKSAVMVLCDSEFESKRLFRGGTSAVRNAIIKGVSKLLEDEIALAQKECLRVEAIPLLSFIEDSQVSPFPLLNAKSDRLLLKHALNPYLRILIEEDLGISLSKIPLAAQLHFFRFLATQDQEGFNRLKEHISTEGLNRELFMQAFIANAYNPKACEDILSVKSKLNTSDFNRILNVYVRVTQAIDEVEEYLLLKFEGLTADSTQIRKIRQNLLAKGSKLLDTFSARLSKKGFEVEDLNFSIARLESVVNEVYLFGETLKTFRDSNLTVDQIRQIEFLSCKTSDLSESQKQVMRDIAKERCVELYGTEGYKLPYGEFIDSLNQKDTQFRILEVEGALIAFLRLNPTTAAQTLYIGSFNTDSLYDGYRFGFTLFTRVLESEGSQYSLTGYVHKNNSRPRQEYAQMGFIEEGEELDAYGKPTGYVIITRPIIQREQKAKV